MTGHEYPQLWLVRFSQAVKWRCMTGEATKSSFTSHANQLALAWSVPQSLDSSVGNALGSHSQGAELKSSQTTQLFLYGSLWA
ncbi:unnamed protein product [Ixodes persulcatus]